MQTTTQTIAFIGGGNIAHSLIKGLIKSGYDRKKIIVSDSDPTKLKALKKHLKITLAKNNLEAISKAQVVFLAVKPQILPDICAQIAATVQKHKPIIISVAAGIRLADLQNWLGSKIKIVRCMPNFAAEVGKSMTGLYAEKISIADKKLVARVLNLIGVILWLEKEDLLDVITCVCGSGPGIIYLFIECLQQAAIKLGIPVKAVENLILQTVLGATILALHSEHDVKTLREQVTSPQGVTATAIRVLEQNNIEQLFKEALCAAHVRCKEIARK